MSVHSHSINMKAAARHFGISRDDLFKALRKARLFSGRLPRESLVASGHFCIEHSPFTLPGTKLTRFSSSAKVTGKGMALIGDLINGQNYEVEPTRQVLPAKRQELPHKRGSCSGRLHLLSLVAPLKSQQANKGSAD